MDFGALGTATQVDEEITAFDGTGTYFKYEVKGANSFTQTGNTSRENGTTFVQQELSLQLPKMSKEDHKEFKLLTHGLVQVIVEDYNGNYFVMGLENGAEVTAFSAATGAAMGDLSGYSLTLSASEAWTAPFYTDAVSFLATLTEG